MNLFDRKLGKLGSRKRIFRGPSFLLSPLRPIQSPRYSGPRGPYCGYATQFKQMLNSEFVSAIKQFVGFCPLAALKMCHYSPTIRIRVASAAVTVFGKASQRNYHHRRRRRCIRRRRHNRHHFCRCLCLKDNIVKSLRRQRIEDGGCVAVVVVKGARIPRLASTAQVSLWRRSTTGVENDRWPWSSTAPPIHRLGRDVGDRLVVEASVSAANA